jgi:membrane associated rhomboid family serine protease
VSVPPNPEASIARERIARSAALPALVVLLLWVVHALDHGLDLGLHRLGVLPRRVDGLFGILCSPFVHGDTEHLFNNSVPIFLLGWGLMYFYPRVAGPVVLASWLVSGMWVWISARSNYHIGASGVVYGLAAFLFVSGLLRRQRTLMGLSLLVVFLYGSMVWGIFPLVPRISWESHLWGAVAGTLMAVLYRHVPPAVQDPPEPVFDDDDDPDAEVIRPGDRTGTPDQVHVVYHPERIGEAGDAEDGRQRSSLDDTLPLDPDRTSGTLSKP